jgi:hypothetical protein
MIEVALLTNSIAVMSAAPKAVAVSRAGANVANIGIIPFLARPTIGPMPLSMQEACQLVFL